MSPDARALALLVCTYRRPKTFAKLMKSVATLDAPEGVTFSVVVGDNNAESAWESYVGPGVAGLRWPVHYGHEASPGYSNARNKALEIALRTDAGIFLFVDDDMLLDKAWLTGHLRSFAEMDAEVVSGRVYGVRERFPHGALLEKCGTNNVAFSRRLVDPSGLRLRFDPALNTLGTEDQAFFRAAHARGVVIKKSDYPLVYNYYGREAAPEDEILNKMHTTAAMHRNMVAMTQREKGFLPAAALAMGGLRFGLKGVVHTIAGAVQAATRKSAQARKSGLSAQKEFLKMRNRFAGLSGKLVSRQDIRRSDPASDDQR